MTSLTEIALDLAVRIRDSDDPDQAAAILLPELRALKLSELRHLVLILAAMVDVDQPSSQVLAWCHGVAPNPYVEIEKPTPERRRKGCPSEAQYRRHRKAGENCQACRAHMRRVEADRRARHPEWVSMSAARRNRRAS